MKKLYILLFFVASFSMRSMAQDNYLSVQYSTGFGLGNTHDYVNKYSFRGVSMDYKHFLSSELAAVGFDFNWNVLYEKRPYDTYTIGTASLSGTQYRSMNLFSYMATADYFFADLDHAVRPFVGLGAGAVQSIENVDMGIYRYNNKEWHFGIKPQAGVWYYLSDNTNLTVSAEYLYAFKTKDTDYRQMLTLNIGLTFRPY